MGDSFRRVAVVVLLCACARRPPVQANVALRQGYRFAGEKALTIVGNDDDSRNLGAALRVRGFMVREAGNFALPSDLRNHAVTTRWVLGVDGLCNGTWLNQFGAQTSDLQVQVFEAKSLERVMIARITPESDCPEGFYKEVAAALEKGWAQ